ncbi:MAG: L-threonylcarbamoyladenylate synthase [Clostridia bacterium]
METKIFDPTAKGIRACGEIIKNGGLVAFPTETVYGLGANGLDECAVSSIFKAKGRPSDNPLILHIAKKSDASALWSDIPNNVRHLMDAFFPGPLTIIYNKSSIVPNAVTAGLKTVAVRMPSNKIAEALIKSAGVPIAAPSANKSGRPSPTGFSHVKDDMIGVIDAIIDGGDCDFGLESTVVSMVGTPTVLRPGAITPTMLEQVLGDVVVSPYCMSKCENEGAMPSPGMKHRHYAPRADAIAFFGTPYEAAEKIAFNYDKLTGEGKRVLILSTRQTSAFYGEREKIDMGDRGNISALCKNLFPALRKCDDFDVVLCETIPETGMGLAYMNRLMRACGFNCL